MSHFQDGDVIRIHEKMMKPFLFKIQGNPLEAQSVNPNSPAGSLLLCGKVLKKDLTEHRKLQGLRTFIINELDIELIRREAGTTEDSEQPTLQQHLQTIEEYSEGIRRYSEFTPTGVKSLIGMMKGEFKRAIKDLQAENEGLKSHIALLESSSDVCAKINS